MSYQSKDLSVLAHANGFTLWHYKTECDASISLFYEGYFNAAVDMLRVGDIIVANTTIDQSAAMVLVTQSSDNRVAVARM